MGTKRIPLLETQLIDIEMSQGGIRSSGMPVAYDSTEPTGNFIRRLLIGISTERRAATAVKISLMICCSG